MRMTKRFNPPQFNALIALTSIRPEGDTHAALFNYLVLGYPKMEAARNAGVVLATLNEALKRLELAEFRARAFVGITPAETTAPIQPSAVWPAAPGSLS